MKPSYYRQAQKNIAECIKNGTWNDPDDQETLPLEVEMDDAEESVLEPAPRS